ncbi:MAG: histidinol dehydrogenase [Pseudomonadota bacterium]
MAAEVSFYRLEDLDAAARQALMVRTEDDLGGFMAQVEPVIAAVEAEGDQALIRFAKRFDQAEITEIKASEAEFDAAFDQVGAEVRSAIEYGIENIRRFHEEQMPEPMWLNEVRPGAFAGDRFTAIPSVACYVPRGKGSFPSVLMMTTVPAVVAGVPRVVVLTPPGPDGTVDAASLVAARIAGVRDVYKCGGAQAVAAVAHGTDSVPRCHKIVGPGSPYFMAAKRLLAELIDPGTPAGPSESIVLAERGSNPRLAALDVIIESEHGADSSAYLVTDCPELAAAARRYIPDYWAQMSEERVGYSSAVLGGPRGGIVLAPDMAAALAFVNDYAPEHLQILAAEPFTLMERIEHAGEILLGEHTPGTIANFVLGPNAVLPTSGAAKTASPLSVFDYMKRSSIGYVTSAGYPELAKHARTLALYEGFDGHAAAVSEARETARRDD